MADVYQHVVRLLTENPQEVQNLTHADLQPLLDQNLVSGSLKAAIERECIRKAPHPRTDGGTSGAATEHVRQLMNDHHAAWQMTTDELGAVVRWADEVYYDGRMDPTADQPRLSDKVYDYVKRVWNARVQKTNDSDAKMRNGVL